VTERQSHSIQYERSQRHLMKDWAWLSWEWSAQLQESGKSRYSSHVVSSRFVGISQERSQQRYLYRWLRTFEITIIKTLCMRLDTQLRPP